MPINRFKCRELIKLVKCGRLIKVITIRTRTLDGTRTTQTQLEVRKCDFLNICFLISWSLPGGFVNNTPGFGWNLGAPSAVPQMPMPQPPSPSRYNERYQHASDSSDSGVDEVFSAKDAGAVSFAHYIVKWVSCLFLLSSDSHDSFMCSRSLLLRKLFSLLYPHKHKHNCVIGVQRSLQATPAHNRCRHLSSPARFSLGFSTQGSYTKNAKYLHYFSSIFCRNQQNFNVWSRLDCGVKRFFN